MFSPVRAVLAAADPAMDSSTLGELLSDEVTWFVAFALGVTVVLNLIAIARVRIWNPSRELRPGQAEHDEADSIWGVEHDLAQADADAQTAADTDVARGVAKAAAAERARTRHIDARTHAPSGTSRQVWDNPVLWREVCTWAYGRKVLIIRLVYLLLFAMAWAAVHWATVEELAAGPRDQFERFLPAATLPMALFALVSFVIVNALAVTSITSERDGQAIDLLLVTDISPREFVLGKLGGVFWITKEMVLLPMFLCLYLFGFGIAEPGESVVSAGRPGDDEHFRGVVGDPLRHDLREFAEFDWGQSGHRVLSVPGRGGVHDHDGQIQRAASIINCPRFWLPSWEAGWGCTSRWGFAIRRRPLRWPRSHCPLPPSSRSPAFCSRNQEMTVFLVTAVAYGFATAAMLVPAVYEFDIAMGRTKSAGDE